jgi:hypothetical protein
MEPESRMPTTGIGRKIHHAVQVAHSGRESDAHGTGVEIEIEKG